jgi:hypothetical protein
MPRLRRHRPPDGKRFLLWRNVSGGRLPASVLPWRRGSSSSAQPSGSLRERPAGVGRASSDALAAAMVKGFGGEAGFRCSRALRPLPGGVAQAHIRQVRVCGDAELASSVSCDFGGRSGSALHGGSMGLGQLNGPGLNADAEAANGGAPGHSPCGGKGLTPGGITRPRFHTGPEASADAHFVFTAATARRGPRR